jgi:hypothetical protein
MIANSLAGSPGEIVQAGGLIFQHYIIGAIIHEEVRRVERFDNCVTLC